MGRLNKGDNMIGHTTTAFRNEAKLLVKLLGGGTPAFSKMAKLLVELRSDAAPVFKVRLLDH
jgi:hypothetical protein